MLRSCNGAASGEIRLHSRASPQCVPYPGFLLAKNDVLGVGHLMLVFAHAYLLITVKKSEGALTMQREATTVVGFDN